MKEQKPPLTAAELEKTKRDPDRQYRYVGTDKDGKEKLEKRIDEGYKIEGEGSRAFLVSCPKDEYLARQEKARRTADEQRKSAAKMRGDTGVAPIKGQLTDTNEVAVSMRKAE